MQLGPTEILIIAVIIILLFGVGKIPKVARELGEGIRAFRKEVKPDEGQEQEESPAAQEINTGGGASVGNSVYVQGDFIGRDQIFISNYADLSPFARKPLAVFTSSTEEQQTERDIVFDIIQTIGKVRIMPTLLDLNPSNKRSDELRKAGLQACNVFLLFIPAQIDPEQKAEYQLAKENRLELQCAFAEEDRVTHASQELEAPAEMIIAYHNPVELKEILGARLLTFLFDDARKDNTYQLTKTDLGVLLGLAETFASKGGWLSEVHEWLYQMGVTGTKEPQATTMKPQATTMKPQATTMKPQATTMKPQATTMKPQANRMNAETGPSFVDTIPSGVKPGSPIKIEVQGFGPLVELSIEIGKVGYTPIPQKKALSDKSGRYATLLIIPRSAVAGEWWIVTVRDVDRWKMIRTAPFEIGC